MTPQLIAFWAGGAVCCLLFSLRLRHIFLRAVLFSLCWPVSVPLGILIHGQE